MAPPTTTSIAGSQLSTAEAPGSEKASTPHSSVCDVSPSSAIAGALVSETLTATGLQSPLRSPSSVTVKVALHSRDPQTPWGAEATVRVGVAT